MTPKVPPKASQEFHVKHAVGVSKKNKVRSMNYLIAILADRIQAESAYTTLKKAGIPTEEMTILGRGYKTADEFGFIDPLQKAKKQALLMASWLVPFGFGAGYTFSYITGLETFDWAGVVGGRLIGGLLGAIAGGMGSFFVGGGVGLSVGGGDALPYKNYLNAGKYLLVVKGSESLQNKALPLLRRLEPENIQSL